MSKLGLEVHVVATRLGRHPNTVRRWIRDGRLKAVNVSGGDVQARYVIPEEAYLEFVRTSESFLLGAIRTR